MMNFNRVTPHCSKSLSLSCASFEIQKSEISLDFCKEKDGRDKGEAKERG